MRTLLCSCAALGAGGWAMVGAGPDFERTVKRSPEAVYAAFSSVAPATVETTPRTAETPELVARIEKQENRQIHFKLEAEGNEVVSVTLDFEPVEGGTATRITAELDMDQSQLQTLAAYGAAKDQMIPGNVPEPMIDMAFAHFMAEMVDDVEAGRPLDAAGGSSRAWRSTGHSTNPSVNRSEAAMRQRQAVQPMNRPRPMVDPNQAAREYMNGGSGASDDAGGWSR